MENVAKSLSEILLDPNNSEKISLQTEDGQNILFEQVAIIPHYIDEEKVICCALRPVEPIGDIDKNAILFFSLEQTEDGEEFISLIDDEDLIEELHDILVNMAEEEEQKN